MITSFIILYTFEDFFIPRQSFILSLKNLDENMALTFLFPLLALLAGAVQGQTDTSTTNTTLVPVTTANSTLQDAAPSRNITLNWASLNSSQMVAVALAMNYSTIVLEDLVAISNVECSASSVEVTFNDTAEFDHAQTQWVGLSDDIVLITNHMGNCDSDFERGFFLANMNSLMFDASNMTVIVSAEKTNVTNTACKYALLMSCR